MMNEIINDHQVYEEPLRELRPVEKACLKILKIREKLKRLLSRCGEPGEVLYRLVNRLAFHLIWPIEKKTGFLDMMENCDFIALLDKYKRNMNMGNTENVVYVGSANDISVRRVFPQALHIDILQPKYMPNDYYFLKADACSLPLRDDSVDLVITKCLTADSKLSPEFASEMARVVKRNGQLFLYWDDPRGEFNLKFAGKSGDKPEEITGLQLYEKFVQPFLQQLKQNMEAVGFILKSSFGCTLIFEKKGLEHHQV